MFKKFDEFLNERRGKGFRVFCDLDGVLVDFDRGFVELADNTEKLLPKDYEKKHGTHSIWKLIDKLGESFWTNLDWTKDSRELWDYLKQYDPIILSAPSRHPGCFTGKTKWVKQNLGIDQEPITKPAEFTKETRLILATHKHEFVQPAISQLALQPILIDDTEVKLENWSNAGGTGILHNDATDTIRVMEEIMHDKTK